MSEDRVISAEQVDVAKMRKKKEDPTEMVEIMTFEDITHFINGKRWEHKAERWHRVPRFVANVLIEAGKRVVIKSG